LHGFLASERDILFVRETKEGFFDYVPRPAKREEARARDSAQNDRFGEQDAQYR